MSDPEIHGAEDLPEDHPLAGYNGTLDDHESHIEALSQYLAENPEEIESLMLIVNTDDASETIPSMHEEADFKHHVWYQLAAHISHVANAFEMPPELATQYGLKVLEENHGGGA
jgi:hypothetical protein